MSVLSIPTSFGEATDKVTILEIKRERITNPAKLTNIAAEYHLVAQPLRECARRVSGFDELFARLKEINSRLWEIEEDIRRHEREADFGPEFIHLARSVYRTNDERARVKRELDRLFDSSILEEKSYVDHGPASK